VKHLSDAPPKGRLLASPTKKAGAKSVFEKRTSLLQKFWKCKRKEKPMREKLLIYYRTFMAFYGVRITEANI
jgi:hypothetical protein